MKNERKDWAALAKMPKFVELHSRKKAFLLTLWCLGNLFFYSLPICAGYYPDVMKVKILGRLNVCYFFCIFEFVMTWIIAIIYTHKANTIFDPLTEEVLADISQGAKA